MKGNETFKIAVRNLTEVSFEVLRRHNLTPDDMTAHSPSSQPAHHRGRGAGACGIPAEKVVVNIYVHRQYFFRLHSHRGGRDRGKGAAEGKPGGPGQRLPRWGLPGAGR